MPSRRWWSYVGFFVSPVDVCRGASMPRSKSTHAWVNFSRESIAFITEFGLVQVFDVYRTDKWNFRSLPCVSAFVRPIYLIYKNLNASFYYWPATHSLGRGGQTSNDRWCLSASSVVCNAAHMQRNLPWGARGGPVELRPVRATPGLFIRYAVSAISYAVWKCAVVKVNLCSFRCVQHFQKFI